MVLEFFSNRLMKQLKNLKELYTCYNYLSSEMLLALAENCGETLRLISVKLEIDVYHNHTIDDHTWQQVRQKVNYILRCIG